MKPFNTNLMSPKSNYLNNIDSPLCPNGFYTFEDADVTSSFQLNYVEPNLNLYSSSRPLTAPTTHRTRPKTCNKSQKIVDILNMTLTSTFNSFGHAKSQAITSRDKRSKLTKRECEISPRSILNIRSNHPRIKKLRGTLKRN